MICWFKRTYGLWTQNSQYGYIKDRAMSKRRGWRPRARTSEKVITVQSWIKCREKQAGRKSLLENHFLFGSNPFSRAFINQFPPPPNFGRLVILFFVSGEIVLRLWKWFRNIRCIMRIEERQHAFPGIKKVFMTRLYICRQWYCGEI